MTGDLSRLHFNNDAKKMSTILTSPEFENSPIQKRIFSKGGSDVMLKLCTHLYTEQGVVEITEELRKEVEASIGSFADKTLRTLVLAYKDI